MSDLSKFLHSG